MSKDFKTRDRLQQRPTVWVLVGLPRIGKSTWANLHSREMHATIVSTDDVRRALGIDRWDRAKEPLVWGTFKTMCKALLARGQNLIVDNPNHTVASRKQWVQMAQEGVIELWYVLFKEPTVEEWKRRCETTDFPWEVVQQLRRDHVPVEAGEYPVTVVDLTGKVEVA